MMRFKGEIDPEFKTINLPKKDPLSDYQGLSNA